MSMAVVVGVSSIDVAVTSEMEWPLEDVVVLGGRRPGFGTICRGHSVVRFQPAFEACCHVVQDGRAAKARIPPDRCELVRAGLAEAIGDGNLIR